jgi:hypothetical protein
MANAVWGCENSRLRARYPASGRSETEGALTPGALKPFLIVSGGEKIMDPQKKKKLEAEGYFSGSELSCFVKREAEIFFHMPGLMEKI